MSQSRSCYNPFILFFAEDDVSFAHTLYTRSVSLSINIHHLSFSDLPSGRARELLVHVFLAITPSNHKPSFLGILWKCVHSFIQWIKNLASLCQSVVMFWVDFLDLSILQLQRWYGFMPHSLLKIFQWMCFYIIICGNFIEDLDKVFNVAL